MILAYLTGRSLPSSTTNQKVYSDAGQFAGSNDTYEKFNSAIAAQNLNKRIANDVTPHRKHCRDLKIQEAL